MVMSMNIKKTIRKLEVYFDLSKQKQKEKHEKLLNIIARLEQKKTEIKVEMVVESEKGTTTEDFHDLQNELKVVSKLLKKAKQHDEPEHKV